MKETILPLHCKTMFTFTNEIKILLQIIWKMMKDREYWYKTPKACSYYFFFLIGKQNKYTKSIWKRCTKYTWSIQVAAEYKQKKRKKKQQTRPKTSNKDNDPSLKYTLTQLERLDILKSSSFKQTMSTHCDLIRDLNTLLFSLSLVPHILGKCSQLHWLTETNPTNLK